MSKAKPETTAEPGFEARLERLETISDAMRRGDLGLEAAPWACCVALCCP